MTMTELLDINKTITVGDFLKVYNGTEEIKVKIDHDCDFEMLTVNCENISEMMSSLADIQIANVSFELDENFNSHLFIECKPMLFLDPDEITELINDPDYLQVYVNRGYGFAKCSDFDNYL